MPRSKRNISTTVNKTTGVEVETCHCRKCRQDKSPSQFFTATDLFLDTSGFMSVCKDCINEIYQGFYQNEQSIEKTILRICRLLNIKYDISAIEALKTHLDTLEKKGVNTKSVFGLYKNKIISVQKTRISEKGSAIQDLTFEEPSSGYVQSLPQEPIPDLDYYERSWGAGSEVDYKFLEEEFQKWRNTTKCDTQAEEVLVREICHLQNDIRRARIDGGKSIAPLVKSLQEIMKNSALTPALQNAASSGKSLDTFGVWAKEIENTEPGEWFKNQKKYRDMDGFQEDLEDIKRSTGNFITGSRDFNLEFVIDADLDDGDL